MRMAILSKWGGVHKGYYTCDATRIEDGTRWTQMDRQNLPAPAEGLQRRGWIGVELLVAAAAYFIVTCGSPVEELP